MQNDAYVLKVLIWSDATSVSNAAFRNSSKQKESTDFCKQSEGSGKIKHDTLSPVKILTD